MNVNPAFVQSILDSTPAAPRAKHMADSISKTVANVIIPKVQTRLHLMKSRDNPTTNGIKVLFQKI